MSMPRGSVSVDADDELELVLTGPVSSVCEGFLARLLSGL